MYLKLIKLHVLHPIGPLVMDNELDIVIKVLMDIN